MKRRNSTLVDLNAFTALKHQKLDMIKYLEQGLWRDYTEPTGFAKLEDMHPYRLRHMMNRSAKFIRYEKNQELRDLEERIFNLIMAEEHTRSILAKKTINKTNKKSTNMNNTKSTTSVDNPMYNMGQNLDIIDDNNKYKEVKISRVVIELNDNGNKTFKYRYKPRGHKVKNHSPEYTEAYLKEAVARVEKRDAKAKITNANPHFDFSDKSKTEITAVQQMLPFDETTAPKNLITEEFILAVTKIVEAAVDKKMSTIPTQKV